MSDCVSVEDRLQWEEGKEEKGMEKRGEKDRERGMGRRKENKRMETLN